MLQLTDSLQKWFSVEFNIIVDGSNTENTLWKGYIYKRIFPGMRVSEGMMEKFDERQKLD